MAPRALPPAFDAYLFDLDGTVYLGSAPIPGAGGAIARLRARGARVAFLSNKPIQTCGAYARKLTALGIPAQESDVINSAVAIALYLRATAPDLTFYVLGEQPLLDELAAAGLAMTGDSGCADAVIVSWDRAITYDRLNAASRALLRGARFYATNPDVACPTEHGPVPDCGAFIAFLEAATGRTVEAVAGKPSPLMVQVMLERLGVSAERALMVGDRLETDIGVGKAAGCATALVLTGATTPEMVAISSLQPDFVLDSVSDLV